MRSVSCMGSSLLDSRRTSSRDRLRVSASSAHTYGMCEYSVLVFEIALMLLM